MKQHISYGLVVVLKYDKLGPNTPHSNPWQTSVDYKWIKSDLEKLIPVQLEYRGRPEASDIIFCSNQGLFLKKKTKQIFFFQNFSCYKWNYKLHGNMIWFLQSIVWVLQLIHSHLLPEMFATLEFNLIRPVHPL